MTHKVQATVSRLLPVSRITPKSRSLVALSSIDADLTKLVNLQRQAEKLDTITRQLRASIRQGMSSAKLGSYQSPSGIRANLFTSCRFNIDRAKLKRILRPRQFAAVLKPVTSTTLRVR
jgi:hypothetical protein